MKKSVLLLSAVVLGMSAIISDQSVAAEKCFGIAEAGKNEGTLRDGGKKSTKDYMIADWVMVENCADEDGLLEAEAKEIFDLHGDISVDEADNKGLFNDEDIENDADDAQEEDLS